jgi:hypothetical protein
MAGYNNENYLRIHNGCIKLERIILDPESEPSIICRAVEVLILAEAYKREMRGIPRLKAHTIKELPMRNARAPRTLTIRDAKTAQNVTTGNISESKESLSKPGPSPHHHPGDGA